MVSMPRFSGCHAHAALPPRHPSLYLRRCILRLLQCTTDAGIDRDGDVQLLRQLGVDDARGGLARHVSCPLLDLAAPALRGQEDYLVVDQGDYPKSPNLVSTLVQLDGGLLERVTRRALDRGVPPLARVLHAQAPASEDGAGLGGALVELGLEVLAPLRGLRKGREEPV